MKKIIIAFLFLIFYFSLAGQQLLIQDSKIIHEDQERNAVLVQIEPSTDEVKDAFEDFMKDNYDVKLKGNGWFSNKDILRREEVNIPTISDKTLNFYTEIVEGELGTDMKVFASLGYDIYISPDKYPEAYQALQNIADNFVAEYLPNFYTSKINATQERVEDLQKRQEKLEKNIADNKGDIEKMTQEIEELKKENSNLKEEVRSTSEKLANANSILLERKKKFEQVKSELVNQKK